MNNLTKILGLLILVGFAFQSCGDKETCLREVTYTKVTPIYKTEAEMNSEVASESPRGLKNPGKIYFYNNYIFINELKEGVHVVDNTDPENPQNIAFLNIPGNVDISIKDQVLVADSYRDLLTIDISNPLNAQVLGRESVYANYFPQTEDGNYIVDYVQEEVTELIACDDDIPNQRGNEIILFDNNILSAASNSGNTSTGVAGSMARFTIAGNYLYAVDFHNMQVYDISDPTNPNLENTVWIGSDIETIFPYQDKLFIGSRNGMFIYENADPVNPTELGSFEHARACDPVFVKDNFAYVTLHSDNISCGGYTDQLDLIDITDLMNPQLVETFPLDNPHGLSIKNNSLFVCEGDFGLKTFDISDPATFDERLLSHLEGFSTYDVISVPGDEDILLVIGDDGFFQFDFTDPENLKQLSLIPVIE